MIIESQKSCWFKKKKKKKKIDVENPKRFESTSHSYETSLN